MDSNAKIDFYRNIQLSVQEAIMKAMSDNVDLAKKADVGSSEVSFCIGVGIVTALYEMLCVEDDNATRAVLTTEDTAMFDKYRTAVLAGFDSMIGVFKDQDKLLDLLQRSSLVDSGIMSPLSVVNKTLQ
jgi:hypothetical protein